MFNDEMLYSIYRILLFEFAITVKRYDFRKPVFNLATNSLFIYVYLKIREHYCLRHVIYCLIPIKYFESHNAEPNAIEIKRY